MGQAMPLESRPAINHDSLRASVNTGTVLDRDADAQDSRVRVVAIGASAGGADAIAELLAGVPSPVNLAFVIVQHLDPSHGSTLAPMLQRSTTLVVEQAENGTKVQADHVYVIPPDRELSIRGGVLHLKGRPAKVPHRPIDRFMISLAREQSARAIGVVLSGNDSDGSSGLQAIHDAGGITFAQDATAQYAVMPRAAAEAADFILRPTDIASNLVRIAAGGDGADADTDGIRFDALLRLVRDRFGVDFSPYKQPSIHRRILRRMLLDGFATIDDYTRALESSDELLATLHQDLLIGVTAFFREPKQFEALRTSILPALLDKERTAPFRIWVAGCSTGEEVYSIAMTVLEYLGDREIPVTVFGTDVNTTALDFARTGIYTERMLANVSPARRQAFFTPAANGFRVSKKLRELCVFARHDLTRDPPYSNIDLITCRNVLIYFGSALQQRALGALHYALAPNGFLLLGGAESLHASTLFTAEAPKMPLYRKIASSSPAFAAPRVARDPVPRSQITADPRAIAAVAERNADIFLVDHLAPCGVLVNASSDIVRFRGDVDRYVRLVPGDANLNLFHLLRHAELLAELRPAMRRAVEEEATVHLDDIVVLDGEQYHSISVEIVPFVPHAGPPLFWVLFTTRSVEHASQPPAGAISDREETASLRHALHAAVEERESLAGEAAAAAEEAQSSDEELRSANEELETAKEELQSANEELLTLNSELLSRNTTLMQLNDDLENVLSTIEIPTVFVGLDGNVRRFNGPAAELFQLSSDSHARPLPSLGINHAGPDLARLLADATASQTSSDLEVQDDAGRWRLLRIRPYRASDGTIDGAILAVVDIDALKRSVLAAEKSARLSSLLAQAGVLLASSLDYETTLESLTRLAVPDFADWCAVDLLSDDGSIRHLAVSHTNPFMRELAARFQQLTWSGEPHSASHRHETFRESVLVSEVNPSELSGNASATRYAQLVGALGLKSLIRAPLTSRDHTFGTMTFSISDHTYTEDDLNFANELARHAAMAIDRALLFREAQAATDYLHALLGMVAHEIRTPLTTILGWTQLTSGNPSAELSAQALVQIDQSARLLKVFIDDLLDTERIQMRKLRISKEEVDLTAIAETATEMMRASAEEKDIRLIVETPGAPMPCTGDHGRLLQVVWNLVSNAIKFTPEGGEIRVALTTKSSQAKLTVSDTGMGITRETLPQVFDLFRQESSTGERSAGLGLGLAIAKEVVRLHGGRIEAKSDGPGKGATFTVVLPIESRRKTNRRKEA